MLQPRRSRHSFFVIVARNSQHVAQQLKVQVKKITINDTSVELAWKYLPPIVDQVRNVLCMAAVNNEHHLGWIDETNQPEMIYPFENNLTWGK